MGFDESYHHGMMMRTTKTTSTMMIGNRSFSTAAVAAVVVVGYASLAKAMALARIMLLLLLQYPLENMMGQRRDDECRFSRHAHVSSELENMNLSPVLKGSIITFVTIGQIL